MSHYEERLENDLARIRESVNGLGNAVLQALRDATQAFLENDADVANQTVIGDHPINRSSRDIDRLCHAFIARHLPGAGHLRLMSSVIRVNVALERIGDYAVTICRETLLFAEKPPPRISQEVENLANKAFPLLEDAIGAFNDGDADAARSLMAIPEQLEVGMDEIYESLIDKAKKRRLRETVAEFVVFSLLKRVSDQAKNICDQTVFAATGEIKPTKVFQILFVDESNSCLGQMAAAIGRKRYASSAAFASAGTTKAAEVDNDLIGFLDDRGIAIKAPTPRSLEDLQDDMPSYDIIVGLGIDVNEFLEQLPFHTAALRWNIVDLPPEADRERRYQILEENFRLLTMKTEDLMYTLTGENAG